MCVCERERAREKGYVHPQNSGKQRNGTISVIQDLHISLSIGDCIERERERMRERERERERECV